MSERFLGFQQQLSVFEGRVRTDELEDEAFRLAIAGPEPERGLSVERNELSGGFEPCLCSIVGLNVSFDSKMKKNVKN